MSSIDGVLDRLANVKDLVDVGLQNPEVSITHMTIPDFHPPTFGSNDEIVKAFDEKRTANDYIGLFILAAQLRIHGTSPALTSTDWEKAEIARRDLAEDETKIISPLFEQYMVILKAEKIKILESKGGVLLTIELEHRLDNKLIPEVEDKSTPLPETRFGK